MLTSFKLKEERTQDALFDLLLTMQSQQMAVNNLLIADYAQRNNLDLMEQFEQVQFAAEEYRKDIHNHLYGEFGDLDLTELSIQ